jgi:4-amino-4-deoxy-L-arabinose transferase-like glycosyltransferase
VIAGLDLIICRALTVLTDPAFGTSSTGPGVTRRDSIRLIDVGLLVAIAILAFVVGLGSTSFWEPDEPRFAAGTREMLRSGGFLEPVFNGQPRWEKPILLNWLQAIPMGLGLLDELAARLPSAVAGALAVVGVYLLGPFWWSRRAGIVAAAALTSTFRFVTYARLGLTDVPAVAGIILTFVAFEFAADGSHATKLRRFAWWGGWLLVGLTALTKGPVAIIAPAIWIPVTWLNRRTSGLSLDLQLNAIPGLVLAAVVGSSWYAFMALHRGTSFVGMSVGYEMLRRYFDPSFPGPPRGPLFYWRILPGELVPWTLAMAAAVGVAIWHWRMLEPRARHGLVIAATWFLGVMMLCSFSHYKLPHYALPAYPAALLLLGFAIDDAERNHRGQRAIIGVLALTAVLLVAAAVAAMVSATMLPDLYRSGARAVAATIAGGGIASLLLLRHSTTLAAVTISATSATGVAVIATLLLPMFAERAYPYAALGRIVASTAREIELASVGVHTALVYYADRKVEFLPTPEVAAEFLDSDRPRLCVLSSRELQSLQAAASVPLTVVARPRVRIRASRTSSMGASSTHSTTWCW